MPILPKQVVLASGNKGKIREFQALFNSIGVDVIPQAAFNIPEPEETGLSFVENAIIKARNAAAHAKLPAIADDSGIEVAALNGAPGIYSARYAGEPADDQKNNEKLLTDLIQIKIAQRQARYYCAIVFMQHESDPTPIIAEGAWNGTILTAPQGKGGFGYDPLFHVSEYDCTAAELPAGKKNEISHRAIALQRLLAQLRP